MDIQTLLDGGMWYIAFILAITVHEGAHALAAKLGGDDTAFKQGQVSLNPIPHIKREPMGTILIPWLSFFMAGWMMGWASAPYDPAWERRYPHRAAWMVLAGPVANFLLVLISAALIHLGLYLGFFVQPESIGMTSVVEATNSGFFNGVAMLVSITYSLNLVLGVFNLIPVPPLDGSTVIGLFVRKEQAIKIYDFLHNSKFSIIGILIAWELADYVVHPFFTFSLNLLYPGSTYS